MSWDLWIYNWPKDAKTVRDIPDDWQPPVIAPRSEIISKIKAVVPTADFSKPSDGVIDGPGYSIEVNLGKSEDCYSVVLLFYT
ncbi:MAG: hypothetical protein HY298_14445 [Verrucomicrobia bacterium]|nr:hypothetical protein [Verrucomicrobiota bacterium]